MTGPASEQVLSHPMNDTEATQQRASRPKTPLGRSYRTPRWHFVAQKVIALTAVTAVAAVIFTFVFVAREALPMFWDPEFLEEVGIVDLFQAKQWRGYDEPVFVWQPVGSPAKYNIVPLFVGSLKVTLLAMLFSVPLGVGCAIF